MMKKDLGGLHVLVTRPEPQGTELCQEIQSLNGEAIYLPTIEIAPPNDPEAFAEAIATLGDQDWLIFISPQAVYQSVPYIRRAWPELPPSVKFAAVGLGTAKALHEAGYLIAAYPESEWSSEGVLGLPAFESVKNQKIAVIRGEGGRELLDQVFAERDAIVTPVIAYQRVRPIVNIHPYIEQLKANKIDVIVATSFEAVQNLKIMMGDEGWQYISEIPLIVVSERIKILAQDLGFQTIWVARNARHEAILDVLVKIKEST